MLVFDDLASIPFQGLPHICSNFENRIGIVTVSFIILIPSQQVFALFLDASGKQ
jgi:hypothetical protein